MWSIFALHLEDGRKFFPKNLSNHRLFLQSFIINWLIDWLIDWFFDLTLKRNVDAKIVAVDLQMMSPLEGVVQIQGDITNVIIIYTLQNQSIKIKLLFPTSIMTDHNCQWNYRPFQRWTSRFGHLWRSTGCDWSVRIWWIHSSSAGFGGNHLNMNLVRIEIN